MVGSGAFTEVAVCQLTSSVCAYTTALSGNSIHLVYISYHVLLGIQWNPSIVATLGEQHFGRYIGVAFIEGLFCTQIVHLGPGCLAVI